MRHPHTLAAPVVGLVILLAAALLSPGAGPASAANPSNTVTTVDSAGWVGCCTDIAVGTDGLPVISYAEPFIDQDLKVAHCGNAGCTAGNTLTIVDGASSVQLASTSIAMGTDGLPVISYGTAGAGLSVAHCGNAACTTGNTLTALDSSGGRYNSIAIGADGLPVISYDDSGNNDLKVAHCGNSDCTAGNTLTTVDSAGYFALNTSIAIGADGLPVISYLEIFHPGGTRNLKMAHCGNADCSAGNTLTTVDTDVFYHGIAVGTDGLPVISYATDYGNDLKVAHCGNVSCTAGNSLVIVDDGGVANSITIGTNGLPIISYAYAINSQSYLKVAHCGNAACSAGNSLSIIDNPTSAGADVGSDNSITVGADGRPVISYAAANGLFDLKVAHCADKDCLGKPKSTFKIAFTSSRDGNNEVYSMTSDGAGQTNLTNDSGEDEYPAWSPDGTQLAFTTSRDGGDYDIFTMNADGSLQANKTSTSSLTDYGPDWSPSGTQIAFWSDSDGNMEVMKMNADGSGRVNLTNNPAVDLWPSWSPDGTKIAFESNRDGNSEIYVMDADGTDQTRLTNNTAADVLAAWSRDGTKIAFQSDRDGNDEIYVMNTNGSGLTRLTSNTASDRRPNWKAGSEQIAFQSDRDGNDEIYVMNANGSSQTRLTNDTASDTAPNWRRVSGTYPADYDGDGCPDSREAGPNQLAGGRRNPQKRHDYFNPSSDGMNRVDDILLVVNQYFKDDGDGNPGEPPYAPGYNPDMDRTLVGPLAWNLGPPNGLQRVDDILNSVNQYFHDCS